MRRSLALLIAGGLAVACAQEATEEAHHGHGSGGDDHDEGTILPAAVVEATEFAPEYIQHASGVEIIPDVYAGLESPSNTFTH